MIFRYLDFLIALIGLLILSPLMFFIFILLFFESRSPIFKQSRVGEDMRPFKLVKFRTMKTCTIVAPTHLVPSASVTRLGRILRVSKLDELPQLWNVLKGDMSLVGPRPSLFNQEELIEARERLGVYKVRPGITGLSQISGIDMSSPKILAELDAKMIADMSVSNYFKLIAQTIACKGSGDRVKH